MLARISALFVLILATAHAQEAAIVGSIPPTHGKIGYSGFSPSQSHPPTFILTPKSSGARNGKLLIQNDGEGLFIAGNVDGPDPEWSTERGSLLAKDHIEVWIAGAPNIDRMRPATSSKFISPTKLFRLCAR